MSDSKSTEAAEGIAIEALSFIAADPTLLPRFLALTGIEAASIRAAAAEPGFLAGVLQFILAHEPTLLAFCARSRTDPKEVVEATRLLASDDNATSNWLG